jgi:hypothetical protein
VTDWSRESWSVSQASAYGAVMGDPCGKSEIAHMDNAKIAALIPVVRQQVLRGGLRLGRMLNDTLG